MFQLLPEALCPGELQQEQGRELLPLAKSNLAESIPIDYSTKEQLAPPELSHTTNGYNWGQENRTLHRYQIPKNMWLSLLVQMIHYTRTTGLSRESGCNNSFQINS
jgi:hypothetical protein